MYTQYEYHTLPPMLCGEGNNQCHMIKLIHCNIPQLYNTCTCVYQDCWLFYSIITCMTIPDNPNITKFICDVLNTVQFLPRL